MNFKLKHKLKAVGKMNFSEMVSALSIDVRSALLKNLSAYGDSEMILQSLLETPSSCNTKFAEIRISDEYVLIWHKQCLGVSVINIAKLSEVQYFYYCPHKYSHRYVLGLIYRDGSHEEFDYHAKTDESNTVFEDLSCRVKGFENTPSTYSSYMFPYETASGYYHVNDKAIFLEKKKFFSKKTAVQNVIPHIQNVIWCRQMWVENGEDPDEYILELFTTESRVPIVLSTASVRRAFDIVLAIKDNVPHLLYGWNPKYERMFYQSSEKFLEFAKTQMQQ